MKLWHYTCDHGFRGLRFAGTLLPRNQPVLGVALVWATDLGVCDKIGLGLQSEAILTCDRGEFRYEVLDVEPFCPFLSWAEWNDIPGRTVAALTIGRRPEHWYVAESPVPVRLNQRDVIDPEVAAIVERAAEQAMRTARLMRAEALLDRAFGGQP